MNINIDFLDLAALLLSSVAPSAPYIFGFTILLALSFQIPMRSSGYLATSFAIMLFGQLANSLITLFTLLPIEETSALVYWRFVFSPFTSSGYFFLGAFVVAQWPYRRNTFIDATQLFFSFKGCIPRNAFWVATLILMFGQFLAFSGLLTITSLPQHYGDATLPTIAAAIASLPAIVLFTWAGFAIYAKRWHDLGKSGWWTLISLIPIVGPLYCLIMLGFVKGQSKEYPREYIPAGHEA